MRLFYVRYETEEILAIIMLYKVHHGKTSSHVDDRISDYAVSFKTKTCSSDYMLALNKCSNNRLRLEYFYAIVYWLGRTRTFG